MNLLFPSLTPKYKMSRISPLFSLPGEIRNQIYHYALGPEVNMPGIFADKRRSELLLISEPSLPSIGEDSGAEKKKFKPRTTVAYSYAIPLLRTCKLIYHEARAIFFRENQFVKIRTNILALQRAFNECGMMFIDETQVLLQGTDIPWAASLEMITYRDRTFNDKYLEIMLPAFEMKTFGLIFQKGKSIYPFWPMGMEQDLNTLVALDLHVAKSALMPSEYVISELMVPIKELFHVDRLMCDRIDLPHEAIKDRFQRIRVFITPYESDGWDHEEVVECNPEGEKKVSKRYDEAMVGKIYETITKLRAGRVEK